REIANQMGHAAMQEPEPVAVAKIFGALDDGTILEANRRSVDLLYLEAIVASAVVDAIAALAIPQQLQIAPRAIEFDTQWNWKCRGQRPAVAPAPRMRMSGMEQQRGKRGLGRSAFHWGF